MLLEILIAITLGVTAGIITGLIPGIHVNLITALLLSISPTLLPYFSIPSLILFIIALAITHSFVDAIPSIFLGAPDAAHALSVLPGHRMLLNGRGAEAVKFTVIGSLLALVATIIIIPLSIPFIPFIYKTIQPLIGYLLLAVVIYIILTEKSMLQKIAAGVIFLVSGMLGLLVFKIHTLNQPLLALLSGLFGISTLLISLKDNNQIPPQKESESTTLEKKEGIKSIAAAVFSGSLTGLFPGLGSAHAAMIGMQLIGRGTVQGFLTLIGGINTVNFVFSLATFYTIQKARNGAIIAVAKLQETISFEFLIIILLATLVIGCIATIITMIITKQCSKLLQKVNYRAIILTVIALITLLVIIFDQALGLIILTTATCIGMLPAFFNVKRSIAMGCLLLPVILYFL